MLFFPAPPEVKNHLSFFGPLRESICSDRLGLILHRLVLEFLLPGLVTPDDRGGGFIIPGSLLPIIVLDER